MHGGTIEARSEGNNHGSEFIVRLPLLPPPSVPRQDGTLHEDHPFTLLSKIETGHRVLVVDDNSKAAHGIGKLLQFIGYTVSYAYTGDEALTLAEATHFDTIILDIGLPDMDGYEAARVIRNKLGFSGILIALTGYGQEEDKHKAYAAGFSHHLTKPIGIADLQKALQSR
jgi:CheY-like chemotaxis protein